MADRAAVKAKAEGCFKEKNYSEAQTLYRNLYDETRDPKYLYNVAICHYYMNKIADAVPILENLTGARHIFPDSAMFLGFCYRRLNQIGRAKQHFIKLVSQTSGESRIKCRIMASLLTDESGQTEEAQREYESLLLDTDLVAKNRAEVLRRLATLKENKKEHRAALDLYRESLNHDAEGEPALAAKFRMAVCLTELSAHIEAVELLKEVEAGSKDTFLGESASKLRFSVENTVRRTERHIRSYER